MLVLAAHLLEIFEAGLPMPCANQIELHPLCQRRHLREFMYEHKILPIAYSCLAPLPGWRKGYTSWGGAKSEKQMHLSSTITSIAKKLRKTEAQVLLRYAYQSGWATLPKSV